MVICVHRAGKLLRVLLSACGLLVCFLGFLSSFQSITSQFVVIDIVTVTITILDGVDLHCREFLLMYSNSSL